MHTQAPSRTRWYTQPLVWMLIAIPASAVVMGAVMIRLAVSTDDGLVIDDYYRYGKEINLVLARDQAAAARGLDGVIALEDGTGAVYLALSAALEDAPNTLELRLLHATRQGFDQRIALHRNAPDHYEGVLDQSLAPGNWTLELSTSVWRITGRMRAPQQRSARLTPNQGAAKDL